jgi:protein-L-isoaspartate(D-aspartate) O-methyltransferase
MADFAKARRMMVDCQLRTFEVFNAPVLAAFDTVPREMFLPEAMQALAYSDKNIPLFKRETGEARFMLSPMILARMIQSLDLVEGQSVLDIGCGSGYSSAILYELGMNVIGLENDEALALLAREALSKAGYDISVKTAPLASGFSMDGPYDAILINGSVAQRPHILFDQLKTGGHLICIEGGEYSGKAILYVKGGNSVSAKAMFNASAPLLQDFARIAEFQF